MLFSPYVRRVAVSLQLLELAFEHRPLSVFQDFDAFRSINPVVKAPTLICDDGEVLMDSALILDYAEMLAAPCARLMPADPRARQHALRIVGLALAACEKSVQVIYEHKVRPPEKLHQPWLDRVTGQLSAALDALEAELTQRPLSLRAGEITQAAVSTAVTWHFTQQMIPEVVSATRYPALLDFSARAEALPAFAAAPHGTAQCRSPAIPSPA